MSLSPSFLHVKVSRERLRISLSLSVCLSHFCPPLVACLAREAIHLDARLLRLQPRRADERAASTAFLIPLNHKSCLDLAVAKAPRVLPVSGITRLFVKRTVSRTSSKRIAGTRSREDKSLITHEINYRVQKSRKIFIQKIVAVNTNQFPTICDLRFVVKIPVVFFSSLWRTISDRIRAFDAFDKRRRRIKKFLS